MDIFTDWFREFIAITKPTAEDPVLLILDGHYSHTRNIDVINLGRENHVSILCLPPHCTHRMQPLDVGFMSAFKTYYSNEIRTWIRNKARPVTHYQLGELFGNAYTTAATCRTAMNAFRATGLYPCNRHVYTDEMFVAEEIACHCSS